MIQAYLKPILHFITSGLLGVLTYILVKKLPLNERKKEKVALVSAIFSSILLHNIIDFGPGWF
ncbi:hypothetical protein J4471_01045 [Candidatus Woesearchaeota archaeon]|nr:hypothetical protein [Candidatus Woesearchaeota archaeon]